jgi:hypothetical protein
MDAETFPSLTKDMGLFDWTAMAVGCNAAMLQCPDTRD